MLDLIFLNTFFFLCFFLNTVFAFAGPGVTTYQAKIIKPDGYPLEASSVNFKFSILNPAGSCVLYAETFSTVNMSSTGGVISFALGSGVKTYPASATTFEQVFSNITPSLSCDVGGPVNYSPAANDVRKIIMQFHDGSGWQTLPAMSINAVPYAMYANDSAAVGGLAASSFVQNANIPTCSGGQALFYNGTSFSCVALGGSGVTSSTIATALGYTPADGASITAINSSLSSVSSSVGTANSVIASVSSTVYSVSSTVSALQTSVTSLANATAASFSSIVSSQWSTSGSTVYYASGGVGIGTSNTGATQLLINKDQDALTDIYLQNTNVGNGAGSRLGISAASAQMFLAAYSASSTSFGGENANDSLLYTGTGTRDLAFSSRSTSGSIKFYTGGDPNITRRRMTIDSIGNVGIGTSTPVTRLDVSGGVRVGWEATACAASLAGTIRYNSGSVEYCNGSLWTSDFAGVSATVNSLSTTVGVHTSSLTALTASMAAVSSQWITSGTNIGYFNGNVGIGNYTSNINYKFQVHSAVSPVVAMISTDASSNAVVHVASDLDGTPKYGAFGYDFDDNVVKLVNDGSFNTSLKGIMINPTGYVGVMTVSPTAKLHVSAGNTSVAPLKLTSGALLTSAASGSIEYDGFNFYITDGTNTRRTIATDASVSGAVTSSSIASALGYTPANSATVNSLSGTVTTLQGTVASMAGSQWSASGTSINFTTGNVGIGTTNPSSIFDVSGTARISKVLFGDGLFNAPSITFANNPNTGFYNASGWLGISVAGGLKGTWTSSSLGFNAGGAGPQIYFTGGSAANPSYAFNVDSDTGMFNPNASGGSNELAFSTSGVERVRISSMGAVGIGTTAPAAMLNVVNSDYTSDVLRLRAAPSQSAHWFRIEDSSGTTRAYISPNGNMPQLALGVTNSIRLTAEYGGVDEAPAGAAISTGGNLDLLNSGNPGVKTMAGYYNGTNFFSAWEIANVGSGYGSLLLMKSGGYVGVGVSATSARLHIASGTSTVAPLKIISGTLLASPQPGAVEYDGSNFYITDGTGARKAIVSDSGAGNFYGINSLNSSGNIAVVPGGGSFVVSSTTAATSYTNGALIVKGGVGIAGDTYMKGSLNVSGTTSLSGWVGIGTNAPRQILDVAPATGNSIIRATSTNGTTALQLYRNTAGSYTGPVLWANGADLNFGWDSSENSGPTLMTLKTTGGLGIGTTAPEAALHVVNNGKILVDTGTTSQAVMTFRNLGIQQWNMGIDAADNRFKISSYNSAQDLTQNTRFVINNLGYVGIGTSAPTTTLEVNSNGNVYSTISSPATARFTDVNTGANLVVGLNGVTSSLLQSRDGTASAWPLSLNPFGGHVGVGVSIPVAALDVGVSLTSAENIRLRGKNAIEGGEIALMDGTGTGAWEIDNYGASGTERLRIFRDKGENNLTEPFVISPNGYVGINDTAPTASLSINSPLNINAGGNFASRAGALRISDGSSIGLLMDTNQIEQVDSSNYLYLNYNSSASTIVNYGGGYVGVGLIPQRQLHIGKATNSEFVIEQTDALANYRKWNWVVDSGNATTPSRMYIRQLNDALSGGNVVMTMTASGNVGVNTQTPQVKLEVSNSVSMVSNGIGATFAIRAPNSSNNDYFQVGWLSEDNWGIMTADSATHRNLVVTPWGGNFGVGNVSPTYKLDVSGDIHITGTPYRDGGDSAWIVPSDRRLKDVTGKFKRGLREIANIDTIYFNYKKDNPKKIDSSVTYTGVIAQEVQKQIPEAVKEDKQGFLSLNTTPIFWAMINAIKEVYADVMGIKAENAQLKAQTQEQARKIQSLEEENQAIKDRLERIEKSLQQNNK